MLHSLWLILKDGCGITEFFRHGAVKVHCRLLVVLVHNLNAIFEKTNLNFFLNKGSINQSI
jgi:hypothetical protein